MKRIGMVAGGGLWFIVAFWVVYRLSFPSQTVADRLAWETQERTSYALSLEGTHPWWVGLGGTTAVLSSVDKRSGEATPIVTADSVRARIGLFGLLTGAYRVTGDVGMGDGGIDFYVDASNGERGVEVHELDVEAVQFPVNALPPISGFSLVGRGGFDVDVELDAADGMGKADGHFRLGGKDVIIENIPEAQALLVTFDVLPMVIDELDVDLAFIGGKGDFEAGRLSSSLANIDLSGTITLANRLSRSKCAVDIEIELTDAVPATVKSMLASAKQENGKYKYEIRGVCTRATPSPVRPKAARRPARTNAGGRGETGARRRAAKGPAATARPTTPTTNLGGRPPGSLGRLRAPVVGQEVEPLEDEELEDEELEDEELDDLADPGEEGVEDILVPPEY